MQHGVSVGSKVIRSLSVWLHGLIPCFTFFTSQIHLSLDGLTMSRLFAWRNSLWHRLSPSTKSPNVSYATLPLGTPMEEQTLPYYRPEHYYTVKIGDIYKARYKVVGKIGYGAYSTSWLCRDLQCVLTTLSSKFSINKSQLSGIINIGR